MFNSRSIDLMRVRYFLLIVAALLSIQVSAQHFSKEEVLSDLQYLRTSLEETHFDLYAHTTKEAFEQNYVEAIESIKSDSLNLKQVVNLFQRVVAQANNAHTRIAFNDYVRPYVAYFQSGGTVFPLEVAIENGKVLVRKNWSDNSNITVGSELISINGMPINKVLQKIYPQIAAERPYFKNAQLEGYTLPRFYWQVFGEKDEFEVEIVQNGDMSSFRLQAIKALDDYENKRDDILKNYWELKYPSRSTAYLRPGPFGGDEDQYQSFIDSAFSKIKAGNYQNLILDFRDNSGGNDSFSDYLVSYIADQPFRWSSKFQLRTSALLKADVLKNRDTTQALWKSVFEHKNGEVYDYDFGYYESQPLAKRFTGQVYVLVNRQSYSQSTVAAAQIQDYGFGTIVGEETAEYPNLFASIFAYQLPITGLTVDIPKGKIKRVSGIENGKGVIPDMVIKDHLLDDEDEILEGLLRRIDPK